MQSDHNHAGVKQQCANQARLMCAVELPSTLCSMFRLCTDTVQVSARARLLWTLVTAVPALLSVATFGTLPIFVMEHISLSGKGAGPLGPAGADVAVGVLFGLAATILIGHLRVILAQCCLASHLGRFSWAFMEASTHVHACPVVWKLLLSICSSPSIISSASHDGMMYMHFLHARIARFMRAMLPGLCILHCVSIREAAELCASHPS